MDSGKIDLAVIRDGEKETVPSGYMSSTLTLLNEPETTTQSNLKPY
jgi:hypothetical protein